MASQHTVTHPSLVHIRISMLPSLRGRFLCRFNEFDGRLRTDWARTISKLNPSTLMWWKWCVVKDGWWVLFNHQYIGRWRITLSVRRSRIVVIQAREKIQTKITKKISKLIFTFYSNYFELVHNRSTTVWFFPSLSRWGKKSAIMWL